MLNARLYRAALVPFALALVVAAFSLGDGRKRSPRRWSRTRSKEPGPLGTCSRSPANTQIGARDRPATTPLRGGWPASSKGLGDLPVAASQCTWSASKGGRSTVGGSLLDVVAERPGSSGESPILILAHRDAAARGAPAEMSATAALLELARVLAASETRRTIILVSTSGGSGGSAGASQLLAPGSQTSQHGPADAAIVLGDLAAARLRPPLVVPYSDGFGAAPLQLQLTANGAIREEAGIEPGAPSTLGQLAHLAFPLAVGEQGVRNAGGVPAVLVQASGEPGAAASRAPQRRTA